MSVNQTNLDIVEKIQKGDKDAEVDLLIFNKDYIDKKADLFLKYYYGKFLTKEEIVQDLYIGYIYAAKKFDLNACVCRNEPYNFRDYANFNVLNILRKDIYESQIINLPADVLDYIRKIEKLESDGEDLKKMAEALNISEPHLRFLLKVKRQSYQIYDEFNVNKMRLIKNLSSNDANYIYADYNMTRGTFMSGMEDILTKREYEMLTMYYGLDGWQGEDRTLDDVAAVHNVTKESVRQIITKAMGKLKANKKTRDASRNLLDLIFDIDNSLEVF